MILQGTELNYLRIRRSQGHPIGHASRNGISIYVMDVDLWTKSYDGVQERQSIARTSITPFCLCCTLYTHRDNRSADKIIETVALENP